MKGQQECCIAHNKYVSNLVDLNKNTVITRKCGLTYINSKRQDSIGGVDPLDFQGETHTDSLIKANIIC